MVCLAAGLIASGADWPQYRGPNHDGVSTDRITHQWTGSVTNPVWLVSVTNGLCSFAIAGGRAFTQIRRNVQGSDKEVCVALSVVDGSEMWATTVADHATYDGGVGYDDGPRTTPTVAGDSVYVLSSYLNLWRLNAASGAVIWGTNLVNAYGGYVISWQNAASPLIDNDLIYLNANCGSSTLMALRTSDATPVWRSQNEGMTHSTPVLATIHGVRQLIFAAQSGLVSLNPQTGGLLWKFPYPFSYSTSLAASPVVYDDMVFITGAHAYGMGSVAMRADFTNNIWSTTKLWSTNNPASHWMTPIAYQGYLYGQFGIQGYDSSPSTQLKCIDMRTGTVQWSTNEFGHGGTLLVNGRLVVLTERGELVLAEPNPNAYTEVGRFRAIPNYYGDTNKCWNSPAVADGRVYVRSSSYGACYNLSVPALKLDSPEFTSSTTLRFTIRTADDSPIDPSRVPNIQILFSSTPVRLLSFWKQATANLVLTNGIVQVSDINASMTQSFFTVRETN